MFKGILKFIPLLFIWLGMSFQLCAQNNIPLHQPIRHDSINTGLRPLSEINDSLAKKLMAITEAKPASELSWLDEVKMFIKSVYNNKPVLFWIIAAFILISLWGGIRRLFR